MALTNVPQPGQTLAQTRDPIANNFSTINAAFLVDHVEYNLSGQGKHNQVTFPPHVGSVPHVSGEIILFNQSATPTSVPDIWMQRGSVALGAKNPFPITGTSATSTGWSYLPSGILIKWGNISGTFPNATWQSYDFPGSPAPQFNNLFNVTVQAVATDTVPSTTQTFNYLTVNSTFRTTGPNVTGFYWIPRTNVFNQDQRSIFYFAIGN